VQFDAISEFILSNVNMIHRMNARPTVNGHKLRGRGRRHTDHHEASRTPVGSGRLHEPGFRVPWGARQNPTPYTAHLPTYWVYQFVVRRSPDRVGSVRSRTVRHTARAACPVPAVVFPKTRRDTTSAAMMAECYCRDTRLSRGYRSIQRILSWLLKRPPDPTARRTPI
jgi:hypothetical protein